MSIIFGSKPWDRMGEGMMIAASNDLGLDDNEEVVFASQHSTHVISISCGGNFIMKNSVALQSSVLKQAYTSVDGPLLFMARSEGTGYSNKTGRLRLSYARIHQSEPTNTVFTSTPVVYNYLVPGYGMYTVSSVTSTISCSCCEV